MRWPDCNSSCARVCLHGGGLAATPPVAILPRAAQSLCTPRSPSPSHLRSPQSDCCDPFPPSLPPDRSDPSPLPLLALALHWASLHSLVSRSFFPHSLLPPTPPFPVSRRSSPSLSLSPQAQLGTHPSSASTFYAGSSSSGVL